MSDSLTPWEVEVVEFLKDIAAFNNTRADRAKASRLLTQAGIDHETPDTKAA